jgi:hypothetical protein
MSHRLDRPRAGRRPARQRANPRGMISGPRHDAYDETVPFADGDRPPGTLKDRVQAAVTTTFVVVPFAGVSVTVGFHRLLAHHSFAAAAALRVPLAAAGSMSFGRLA